MECLDACKLFVAYLVDALNGADKDAATRQRVMALAPNVLFISAGEWRTKTREQIKSTGYVVDTLEGAVWRRGDPTRVDRQACLARPDHQARPRSVRPRGTAAG